MSSSLIEQREEITGLNISAGRPEGRIGFYDASLSICEEPKSCTSEYEKGFTDQVFTPIRRFLKSRGFTVEPDPKGKDYKSIAKWMWQGNHGNLRVKLHLSVRTIELRFYQNLAHENRYGGEYDFLRFQKMPYLVRLRFLIEVAALIEYLTRKHGYAPPTLAGNDQQPLPLRIRQTAIVGHKRLPTEDPLGSFNDRWDSEWDIKRGGHRFKRDESGWPTKDQFTSGWYGTDAHGVYVEPGAERYWIDHKGHILHGIAYPNMNGMCVFVYGPNPLDYTQVSSGRLFLQRDSFRKVKGFGARAKLTKLLKEAVSLYNFEKAIIYRDLLKDTQECAA